MTELLAPAGDEKTARIALSCGAGAIYLGLKEFSARDSAENFDIEGLQKIAQFAHLLGAKVYVCLNTLIKDSECERFFQTAKAVYEAGADAILLQDIFLGKTLHSLYPDIVLHLSTQAGVCNVWGARLAKEYGFSRVVLARETPLADIKEISRIVETEVFVQGALCSSFSGQCYMSSFAGNNSGNRGRCKQPCRKKYTIDRNGFEQPAYALSLCDLSALKRVQELIEAGVTSLKIEGRLRRAEYVAAAVRTYRAVLLGEKAHKAYSDLKRSFNRGDYTEGLAFGQSHFLSRKVQGHIGERVGEITFRNGKYFCGGSAHKGDGFKILRKGEEVGGAVFVSGEKNGFYLASSEKLQAGDEVRITTDSSVTAEESEQFYRPIFLRLNFRAGARAKITCKELQFESDELLDTAKNAPLTQEQLKSCFLKTDGLPFFVTFEQVETEGVFIPKSALNEIRRKFYAALTAVLAPLPKPLREGHENVRLSLGQTDLCAVMGQDFGGVKADLYIYKPSDYGNVQPPDFKNVYLYLPPFFTSEDERLVRAAVDKFDGIYCDGSYGIVLAQEYQKPLFAGTGFNLTNKFAVSGVKAAGATYFALSKELTEREQAQLSAEGAFALALGDVRVMDLCYCPFEKTCKTCDKRTLYTLTDEAGRAFPLRRVTLSSCRFEVYNCAPLFAPCERAGVLVDFTINKRTALLSSLNTEAKLPAGFTRGHFDRSLL